MPLKPCLDCTRLSLGSRCSDCAPAWRARRGPGWTSKARRVVAMQPWCTRCGTRGDTDNPLTAGHIVAVSRGGSNDESNLQTECRRCNSSQGAR